MRVAAIDLGTNSTRLLVADVVDGSITEVARRLTITGMGEGVDRNGVLGPEALGRVRTVLDGYRRLADELGAEHVLAAATSALRDATDGRRFLDELATAYRLEARLLSGADEAALTFRGASSGRQLAPDTLLVDIGGGSTELVLAGREGIAFHASLQLGCVRLTERFLHSDPPTPGELDACAAFVRAELPPLQPAAVIGVAGTVTTAAAIDLGLEPYDPDRVHGHRVSRAVVERELRRLAGLSVAERRTVRCLEPARAPVIVAGLVILAGVLDRYGLREIEASDRDILHGIALDASESATGTTR